MNISVCRLQEGVELCESLLAVCPESCELRDVLADLHHCQGDGEQAVSTWLRALAECPHNGQIVYHACCFLMAQVSPAGVTLEVGLQRAKTSILLVLRVHTKSWQFGKCRFLTMTFLWLGICFNLDVHLEKHLIFNLIWCFICTITCVNQKLY